MIWDALVLDRWFDMPDIVRSLADALGIDSHAVLVADGLTPDLDVSGIMVMAERSRCRGDFHQKLDIYIRDDELWDLAQSEAEKVRIVRRLCALLHCSCLMGGNDLTGELDWVVGPTGEIRDVVLDETLPADELVVQVSRARDVAA